MAAYFVILLQVLYPPDELGANGKRSRNPSTGSGYGGLGVKINRYLHMIILGQLKNLMLRNEFCCKKILV